MTACVWWHETCAGMWGCQHTAGGAASAECSPQFTQALVTVLECQLVWRSHSQFVGERKVVVCLTVAWSFHRNPVKSDTSISVIKDQLFRRHRSPEQFQTYSLSNILKRDEIVSTQQVAGRFLKVFFLPFCSYNHELHVEVLEQQISNTMDCSGRYSVASPFPPTFFFLLNIQLKPAHAAPTASIIANI